MLMALRKADFGIPAETVCMQRKHMSAKNLAGMQTAT